MIPLDQTIFADPARGDGHDANGVPGNCFQACVASILELPLEEVPHFATFDDWLGETRRFVSEHSGGDLVVRVYAPEFPMFTTPGHFVIGAGPSPRGNFWHGVVLNADTGEMAHDPHPSRAGLVETKQVYAIHSA